MTIIRKVCVKIIITFNRDIVLFLLIVHVRTLLTMIKIVHIYFKMGHTSSQLSTEYTIGMIHATRVSTAAVKYDVQPLCI